MPGVEECETRLKEARQHEVETFANAAAAIREAVRAKKLALHAWVDLAQARGSKDNFKKTYEETVTLQFREDQGCEEYVRKALQTGLFSRLGV